VESEAPTGAEPRKPPSYSRFIFRAPSLPISFAAVVLLTFLSTALVWWVGQSAQWFLTLWAAVFLGPGIVAAVLTPSFARALGGRIGLQRSGRSSSRTPS